MDVKKWRQTSILKEATDDVSLCNWHLKQVTSDNLNFLTLILILLYLLKGHTPYVAAIAF